MMKKIITSAAVAAALTTVAFATGTGTLSVDGGTTSVSKELIEHRAVDINLTKKIDYKAGVILATASEAGFELKFPGLKPIGTLGLEVKDAETNATVATFQRNDTDADSVIMQAVGGTSIIRNKMYKLVSDDDNTSITDGDLKLTLPKGTTTGSMELVLTDNTGTTILDDNAKAPVINIVEQFFAELVTPLSADIDAATDFKEFYTGSGAKATTSTTDTYAIKYTNLRTSIDHPADADKVEFVVFADQNLTTYDVAASVSGGVYDMADYDKNVTAALDGEDSDNNQSATVTLTTDKTGPMSVTKFTIATKVTFETNGTKSLIDSGTDAGTWGIYGYTAQIPNVTAKVNTFETVIKYTNRGETDAAVYFTLRDPDGTVAKFSTDDIAALNGIPAGQTTTYKASELLADRFSPVGDGFQG
jgi:hypothetical protein